MNRTDDEMVLKFTRDGVLPGEEVAFAAEHGYELELYGPSSMPAGYKTRAVCRGGIRLLEKHGEAAGQDAPQWMMASSVAIWAMVPAQREDEKKVDLTAVALFLAILVFLITVLTQIDHDAGFWDWLW